MPAINYVKGDGTVPQARGPKIIAHICNNRGGWGKGFVVAISKRWEDPEIAYRTWHRDRAHNDFALGAVQLVQVQKDIWVANMVGQDGMKAGSNGPPIRYESVRKCLVTLAMFAAQTRASVHMPRIGCGLAGGTWQRIEPIIRDTLCCAGVPVWVYDNK